MGESGLIALLLHRHRTSHQSSQHFTPQHINTRDIFTALLHITIHHTISAMEVPGGNPNLRINSKAQQKHCLQIRTQILKFCPSAFPYQSIRFVFPHCLRLAYFFPFRGRVPKSPRSHMVYQFKCQMTFFVVFRTEKSSFHT